MKTILDIPAGRYDYISIYGALVIESVGIGFHIQHLVLGKDSLRAYHLAKHDGPKEL
jgi:hypothetical protein